MAKLIISDTVNYISDGVCGFLDNSDRGINFQLLCTPVAIKSLEIDLVLDESKLQGSDVDSNTIKMMAQSICDTVILCSGFDIDTRLLSIYNEWPIPQIINISTNLGEGVPGRLTPRSRVEIRNVSFLNINHRESLMLGGLSHIRSSIESEILNCKNWAVKIPSLLLIGPSGIGKSSLVASIAHDLNIHIFQFESKISNIMDVNAIRNRFSDIIHFSKLSRNVKIVLIEDLDRFCITSSNKINRNLVSIQHEIIQGLERLGKIKDIFVVCTTRHIELIGSNLRRPGRLDREVFINVPSESQRREIILSILSNLQLAAPVDIDTTSFILAKTPAFLGGDILSLIKAARSYSSNQQLSIKEVAAALKTHQPVTARASSHFQVRNSSDTLNNLKGLKDLKKTIDATIVKPLTQPHLFSKFNLALPKGILLYGPPGCAKTTLAMCIANELNRNLIVVSAAQLYSPYVGDSEQLLVKMFHQARMCAPSIIFIDEIGNRLLSQLKLMLYEIIMSNDFVLFPDSLFGNRTRDDNTKSGAQPRLLSTLLIEMDGIGLKLGDNLNPENQIFIIGATNRPNKIDEALLRPGRFDKLIYVPAPTEDERMEIFSKIMGAMPLAKDVNVRNLAKRTVNFSGADLVNLCSEAALDALSKDRDASLVVDNNFTNVLAKLNPSLTFDQLKWYELYSRS